MYEKKCVVRARERCSVQMTKRSESSSPEKQEDQPSSSNQLQLVPASRFGLPDGWCVEEKPRRSGITVDKYYIELDTGLKFRSLAAVQRYLVDGQIDTRTRREKPSSQCTMHSFRRSSSFVLPDGWEIEEVPRKNTNSSHSDKYYTEPGTGRRFRSLISVERYLTEEDLHTPLVGVNKSILSLGSGSQKKIVESLELIARDAPEFHNSTLDATILTTDSTPSQNCSFPKEKVSGETDRPSKLNDGSPPTKVDWILTGPGGNMWNPFIDGSRVADSITQEWSEIFKSSIYDESIKAPRS